MLPSDASESAKAGRIMFRPAPRPARARRAGKRLLPATRTRRALPNGLYARQASFSKPLLFPPHPGASWSPRPYLSVDKHTRRSLATVGIGAVVLRRHDTSPSPRVETNQPIAFIGWTSSPSGSPVELIKGYIPLSISVKGSAGDDYSERAHLKRWSWQTPSVADRSIQAVLHRRGRETTQQALAPARHL